MNRDIFEAGKHIFKIHDRLSEKISSKYGLTNLELNILFFLKSNCGIDTARDMAEKLNLSKSNISDAVDGLTKKGYILGIQDEKDRRYIHLKLLESADIILEDGFNLHDEFMKKVTKDIPKDKLDIAKEVLEQIFSNAIKEAKNIKDI